ncbi:MAG TPA: hypothetical protein VH300_19645 [Thermoleophilaceae bacterium]|jgi:hypothetical protein|nr:hypothetical protein [Thermoleophilaceae bacterium]
MRTRFVALAIVLAVTGSGCGSSSGSNDEPASIVPASAYLYAEATLDPSGDQAGAARDRSRPAARRSRFAPRPGASWLS